MNSHSKEKTKVMITLNVKSIYEDYGTQSGLN